MSDQDKSNLSEDVQSLDLIPVGSPSITERVGYLIRTLTSNGWSEFSCRNCRIWVYMGQQGNNVAVNRKVFVNKATMTNSTNMEKLMDDKNYSDIFRIIIPHKTDIDLYTAFKQLDAIIKIGGCLEPLYPIANAWLRKQTMLVEDRIKAFSNQQYADLEKSKLRAHSEQYAIKRAVAKDYDDPTSLINSLKASKIDSPGPSHAKPVPENLSKEDRSSNMFFDDELILFEPSSHTKPSFYEGSDEEFDMPLSSRRISEPAQQIARSLPIPVPLFMRTHGPSNHREKSPQTPTDIAASIKALARSVHGDSIFGDLPSPRRPAKD